MSKSGDIKPKENVQARQKSIRRKQKDKPKRALSAYNYFVKFEREKITKAVHYDEAYYRHKIDPELNEALVKKLRKDNNKVDFSELGKLVGSRWRKITNESKAYYQSLAELDRVRHANEMKIYMRRNERMRNEVASCNETHLHSHEHYMTPPYNPNAPPACYGRYLGCTQSDVRSNGYGQVPMMNNPCHVQGYTPNNGWFAYNSWPNHNHCTGEGTLRRNQDWNGYLLSGYVQMLTFFAM